MYIKPIVFAVVPVTQQCETDCPCHSFLFKAQPSLRPLALQMWSRFRSTHNADLRSVHNLRIVFRSHRTCVWKKKRTIFGAVPLEGSRRKHAKKQLLIVEPEHLLGWWYPLITFVCKTCALEHSPSWTSLPLALHLGNRRSVSMVKSYRCDSTRREDHN